MKTASTLKIVASAAVFFTGTAALAKDVRPADAVVKVSALNLPNSSASEKSQGLPNANGEKPGNGNGYGHFKGNGLGHGNGNGHGHDSDPESP